MPSSQSESIVSLYAKWGAQTGALFAGELSLLDLMRYQHASWSNLAAEPEDVRYSSADVDELNGLWAIPANASETGVILYFHGGGYVGGSADGVRKLAGHIATASGIRALALDYRLAPENLFPAQLHDAVRAYEWLIKEGYPADRIVLAGDSAGGLLATVVAQYLGDNARDQVAGVVALSPFYDVDAHSEWFEKNADVDVLSTRDGALGLFPMFAGEAGTVSDPYITALSHDPTGMPPVYISFGGAEALVGGAIEYEALARGKGVDITLDIVPDMQHVFHYLAGRAPEADDAISRIGAFVRRVTAPEHVTELSLA
jgi:acetyl esterase/lipase